LSVEGQDVKLANMRVTVGFSLLFVATFWGGSTFAADVIVMGLFTGRAVLSIDGQRRVLEVGQASPEGVKLISADADAAVLEIEGTRSRYTLGNQIGATYAAPAGQVVRLWPNSSGMYTVTGSINGMPVKYLVDTGATTIAMNSGEARRLGISYRLKGQRLSVETASGVERAFKVVLDAVRVGDIQVRNVEAVVLDGNMPSQILLGMSFLSRVHMEREGQALLLRKTN
jgi:aspartyl protease family protein